VYELVFRSPCETSIQVLSALKPAKGCMMNMISRFVMLVNRSVDSRAGRCFHQVQERVLVHDLCLTCIRGERGRRRLCLWAGNLFRYACMHIVIQLSHFRAPVTCKTHVPRSNMETARDTHTWIREFRSNWMTNPAEMALVTVQVLIISNLDSVCHSTRYSSASSSVVGTVARANCAFRAARRLFSRRPFSKASRAAPNVWYA
jgi:hypothetical protein